MSADSKVIQPADRRHSAGPGVSAATPIQRLDFGIGVVFAAWLVLRFGVADIVELTSVLGIVAIRAYAKLHALAQARGMLFIGLALMLASAIAHELGGLAALTTIALAIPCGYYLSLLSRKAAFAAYFSGIIAVVEWPLIYSQFREPSLVYQAIVGQRLSAGAAGSDLRPVGNALSPGLIAVLIFAGLLLAVVSRSWCWPLNLVLAAGHLVALFMIDSRTTFLALLLSVFLTRRLSRKIRLALLGVVVVGAGVTLNFQARNGGEGRLAILEAGVSSLSDHWALGVGWGQTVNFVRTYYDGAIYHLHLLPLHVLFELGVIGALGLLLVIVELPRLIGAASIVFVPYFILDAGVFLLPQPLIALVVSASLLSRRRRSAVN